MKWNCYINRKVFNDGPGIGNKVYVGVETTKEVLDLPNTTKADTRFATLEATKKFGCKEDDVLCLPTCTYDCTETTHSYECDEKCSPTAPVFTESWYPYNSYPKDKS